MLSLDKPKNGSCIKPDIIFEIECVVICGALSCGSHGGKKFLTI